MIGPTKQLALQAIHLSNASKPGPSTHLRPRQRDIQLDGNGHLIAISKHYPCVETIYSYKNNLMPGALIRGAAA
jgi:hypothetical protein